MTSNNRLKENREQMRAWHYTNLQPLFSDENYRKGSLWEGIRYSKSVMERIQQSEKEREL